MAGPRATREDGGYNACSIALRMPLVLRASHLLTSTHQCTVFIPSYTRDVPEHSPALLLWDNQYVTASVWYHNTYSLSSSPRFMKGGTLVHAGTPGVPHGVRLLLCRPICAIEARQSTPEHL